MLRANTKLIVSSGLNNTRVEGYGCVSNGPQTNSRILRWWLYHCGKIWSSKAGLQQIRDIEIINKNCGIFVFACGSLPQFSNFIMDNPRSSCQRLSINISMLPTKIFPRYISKIYFHKYFHKYFHVLVGLREKQILKLSKIFPWESQNLNIFQPYI